MTKTWDAGPVELAYIRPLPGEYTVLVRFTRNIAEDSVYGSTPKELAIQLAKELQEGFDEAAIAGRFQAIRVELPD